MFKRFRLGAAAPVAAGLAAASLAAAGLLAPGPARAQGNRVYPAHVPHQVLAMYYGWWGTPAITGKWEGWTNVDPVRHTTSHTTDYPATGPYDSHDPAFLRIQLQQMKNAGITGLVYSFWGPGNFNDEGFPRLLSIAASVGLSVTAYIEPGPISLSPTPATLENEVQYVLKTYSASPAWLKVDGRPVIFLYGATMAYLKPSDLAIALNAIRRSWAPQALLIGEPTSTAALAPLDGLHKYTFTAGTAPAASAAQIGPLATAVYNPLAAATDRLKILCLSVSPGYDDSKLGRPLPRPITRRFNGQTYIAEWNAALAQQPDWIFISTWNEWSEGSELEPSVEYGTTILDETPPLAARFLASPERPR